MTGLEISIYKYIINLTFWLKSSENLLEGDATC